MNIIKRWKRAAWFSFETFVDAIMARGFGVYSYPPASPEPVRAPRREIGLIQTLARLPRQDRPARAGKTRYEKLRKIDHEYTLVKTTGED